MATYIQGQSDYITQIQPTAPNLAFDAQILQTKQSKYDANHKRVSDLYGSLLNSAMTRSDNIQAKDEFFKIINDDIRRMGGLDFSLDQNVQAAASVFQSIYTNNNIVKDMVWTKNFNNETNRMDAFKNCIDEEKCGGMYWEEGDRAMQYKRLEFKNATAEQALGMGDVTFIPYKSVMKEAMKIAKEANLNIEWDKLSPDGNYLITTKNGETLRSPLTALFNKTIGQNPQFAEMFKTKAYVDRNDWVYSKLNMGEYKTTDEAQLGYLKQVDKNNLAKIEDQADALNIDLGYLDQKTRELEEEFKNGQFIQGSEKYNHLMDLKELQQSATAAKQYTDQILSISATNHAAIGVLTDNLDNQNAYNEFNAEIQGAVGSLIWKDAKSTMKADEFAKMKHDHEYKLSEMSVQHRYNMAEEAQEHANAKDLEDHKKSIGHSSYSGGGKDLVDESNDYINKKNVVDQFDVNAKARANMKKLGFGSEVPTAADIAKWKKAEKEKDNSKEGQGMRDKLRDYRKAYNAANEELLKAKRDANEAAIKFNKIPEFRDVITATDLGEYNKKFDWDYQGSWMNNTFDILNKEYKAIYNKEISDARFQTAITHADGSKPFLDELRKDLKLN